MLDGYVMIVIIKVGELKMSMYQSAELINKDLQSLFNTIPLNQFTKEQRSEILNIMIRFGAVAKFRCRSNTAYENFVCSCLNNIAKTNRVKVDDKSEFEILRAEVQ